MKPESRRAGIATAGEIVSSRTRQLQPFFLEKRLNYSTRCGEIPQAPAAIGRNEVRDLRIATSRRGRQRQAVPRYLAHGRNQPMRRHLFGKPTPMQHLPRPPAPKMSTEHFLICPAALLDGLTPEQMQVQKEVYRVALEQAQEVARPSLPERDLPGVWN
jgi:hypothetical protein